MTMFGWQVDAVDGTVVIRDDNRTEQARFRTHHASGVLPTGVTPVDLADGSAQVFNGRPYAVRRRSRDGEALIRGHFYRFEHDSGRWMHVTRDGWTVARLHRRTADVASPVDVILRGEPDDDDRLAIVLAQECIRPGRPGVLGNVAGLFRRWRSERTRRGRINR